MIASRIAAGIERRDNTLGSPDPWLVDAFGGSSTFAGQKVSEKSALRLVPVYASVKILAAGIGSLPVSVYRGRGRERREDPAAPQWEVLHESFNSEHPSDVALEIMGGHLVGWGNAFAEKVKVTAAGRTIVGEMWPIYPGHVRVDRDKRGRKVFEVTGNARTFTGDTILHVPGFGFNGLTGISPIANAKQMIGVGLAREEWQGNFYANSAQPAGILKVQKNLSAEAADRVKAHWKSIHGGSSHSGEVAVLEEGMDYAPTAVSARDAQYVEAMQFDASTIAALFQVPPSWIGGSAGDSLTYSTVEGEALHWVKFKLRPWLVRFEKAFRHDRDLFPDRGLTAKFNVEALLRGDTAARASFYQTMTTIGAYSINDVRDQENLPPVDGGDIYEAGAATEPEEEP